MVDDAAVERSKHLDVLDAGCGTGLYGPLVAPYARRLVGVDLSSGRLERAAEKNAYDVLVRAELTEYLRGNREAFNLIVSADALVYFGNLETVFTAAAGALREHGVFVFTLEHRRGSDAGAEYRLESHGRYSHGDHYLERVLRASGLQPKIAQAQLRMEAGVPVDGLVVGAVKSPGWDCD
jgi:predicted TPR repeat methyltransferase